MGLAALEVTDLPDFYYGTLCHAPLRAAVLGRETDAVPARLAGRAVHWAEGRDFPVILPRPGAVAEGVLVAGLTDGDRARLDFHEAGFATDVEQVTVATDAGPSAARLLVPQAGRWTPGAPWRLADWAARWGDIATAAAEDVMALMGRADAAAVGRRRQAMLVRAATRLRAQAEPAPTARRHRAAPDDVRLLDRRQPYAAFFAVEEYDLTHRRFDGSMADPVSRAVFISGDAVTVLPYDPARDRVLLIEQIRIGPLGRGDPQPWQLEAIAGRIDPGETPEQAARREAQEEAGITLGPFRHVAAYYPSPGAKAEWLTSYVALTDLPDGIAGPGGKPEEAEDIRGHLLAWDEVEALVASGEINNAPLLVTLLWLRHERPRLRG